MQWVVVVESDGIVVYGPYRSEITAAKVAYAIGDEADNIHVLPTQRFEF